MSDSFSQGVNISTTKIKLKSYINTALFVAITLSGIKGIYTTMREIFVIYPKLSLYYQQLNFDQHIYAQILQKAVIVSVTSFIEAAFGLAMLVKKSHSINLLHTIVGFIILGIALYLKREGALPDFDTVEKLAFFILPA
jgi:hypothetical protein